MKKYIVACLAMALGLLIPLPGGAAVIDLPDNPLGIGFFQDTLTGYVWMDVDNFFNMSLVEIDAFLDTTEFQIASQQEVSDMLSSAGDPDATNFDNFYDTMGGAEDITFEGPLLSIAAWCEPDPALAIHPAFGAYKAPPAVGGAVSGWTAGYYDIGHLPSEMLGVWAVNTNPAPVPEPASLLLLSMGLAGMAGAIRKRVRR